MYSMFNTMSRLVTGPCHDPGSRWSRWGCEGQVRCKAKVYMFYTLSWLVAIVPTMILVSVGVDGDVKGKLDVMV